MICKDLPLGVGKSAMIAYAERLDQDISLQNVQCDIMAKRFSFIARCAKQNSTEIAIYKSLVQTEIVLHIQIQNPFPHFNSFPNDKF